MTIVPAPTDDAPVVTLAPEAIKEAGLRLFYEGLYPQAVEKFEEARKAFLMRGDEVQAAEMLNNLGVVAQRVGRWDDAIRVLGEAGAAFKRLSQPMLEAQVVGNLGSLQVAHGDRKRGMAQLQEAAGMFRALGQYQLQSDTLRALSRACVQGRDFPGALSYYQTALAVLDHPSAGQQALKWMLNLPMGMLGMGSGSGSSGGASGKSG